MDRSTTLDAALRRLPIAAAVIGIGVGGLALVGWHAGMPVLAQWAPGRIPMVYNTAVTAIVAGLVLALRGRVRTAWGIALGGLVAAFGLLNLALRLLDEGPGIESVLFAGASELAFPLPLRMAPNTALGFAVLGAGLVALETESRRGAAIAGLLGALLAAIASVTLVGYVADLDPAYGWWNLGPMAIPTAVALIALATGLVAAAMGADRRRGERAPLWPALAAGLGVLAAFAILALALAAEDKPILAAGGLFAGAVVGGLITLLIRLGTIAHGRARDLGQEVAERRRVETALRESEELLRTILATLPVGLWITDASGVIRESNEAGRRIWGGARYVGIEQYGEYRGWWSGTGRRIGAEEWALARAVRGGETSIGELVDIEAFDGSRKTVSNSAVPIRAADGSIAGAVVVVQDVTEAVRAEREIRRLNDELEARIRERTTHLEAALAELESFSSAVAHDLRQPLRAIDGFSLALLEEMGDALSGEQREWFDRIRAANRRMGSRIDELLGFARLARAPVRRHSVDLAGFARAKLDDLRHARPDRVVELVASGPIRVEADPEMARLAIGHLVDNAWKFTASHPAARIEIGERTIDGERVIFVRDDGVGFDPAYRDKLFRAFEHLHSPGEFSGSGIGLAIVKRIAERHGGRVWAESVPERGATFFVTWERAPAGFRSSSSTDESCAV